MDAIRTSGEQRSGKDNVHGAEGLSLRIQGEFRLPKKLLQHPDTNQSHPQTEHGGKGPGSASLLSANLLQHWSRFDTCGQQFGLCLSHCLAYFIDARIRLIKTRGQHALVMPELPLRDADFLVRARLTTGELIVHVDLYCALDYQRSQDDTAQQRPEFTAADPGQLDCRPFPHGYQDRQGDNQGNHRDKRRSHCSTPHMLLHDTCQQQRRSLTRRTAVPSFVAFASSNESIHVCEALTGKAQCHEGSACSGQTYPLHRAACIRRKLNALTPQAGLSSESVQEEKTMKNEDLESGGFFRLLHSKPTYYKEETLIALGEGMHGNRSGSTGVPAGYTYLGQFIDHDMTSTRRIHQAPGSVPVDPADLINDRTPALDLDCLYGDGNVDAEPPLLGDGRFRLGRSYPNGLSLDLPRETGSKPLALIADRRNDENALVARIHLAFLAFHNAVVKEIGASGRRHPKLLFELAREEVTKVYQHIVVYDFLRRLLDNKVFKRVFEDPQYVGLLGKSIPGERGRLPVEFTAAAFRFGHSMVREGYTLNENSFASLADLFEMTGRAGLRGQVNLPDALVPDWMRFFYYRSHYEKGQLPLMQKTSAIDFRLAPGLGNLPGSIHSLGALNLLRGNEFGLPCAQDAVEEVRQRLGHVEADSLGILPINHSALAAEELLRPGELHLKTPLWFYLMFEASSILEGEPLGPLCSLIIAETFRSVLMTSRYNVLEGFDPQKSVLGPLLAQKKRSSHRIGMEDLLLFTFPEEHPSKPRRQ